MATGKNASATRFARYTLHAIFATNTRVIRCSFIDTAFYTYDDASARVECRRASGVDASKVFLPPANALCDVLLVAPYSLRVREVNCAYQDPSLSADVSQTVQTVSIDTNKDETWRRFISFTGVTKWTTQRMSGT